MTYFRLSNAHTPPPPHPHTPRPYCENDAKLYFDAKHLERDWLSFLANIECWPKFLEYASPFILSEEIFLTFGFYLNV